ncbi:hypothetical protein NKH77_20450 [Streptomyces sp. M19]
MNADLVVTGVGLVEPEGFDYRSALGRRGYKYLPDATRFFLAAAKRALEQAGSDGLAAVARSGGPPPWAPTAAAALHAEMDRTVVAAGADELSPVLAPYFSINLFGSRLASEHGLKGFNLTLTSPGSPGSKRWRPGGARWPRAGPTGCWPGPPRRRWTTANRARRSPRPGPRR